MNRVEQSVQITALRPTAFGGLMIWGKDTERGWKRRVLIPRQLRRLPDLRVGQAVRVRGSLGKGKYAKLITADAVESEELSGHLIFEYLRLGEAFRGIGMGRTRLAKLEAAYGRSPGRLTRFLASGNSAKLEPLLGDRVARNLVAAWQSQAFETEVVEWLSKLRLDAAVALRLIKVYGEETVQKLEDNPYRLVPLVGFSVADRVAKRLRLRSDDPRRLSALAGDILRGHAAKGASVVPLEAFRAELRARTNRVKEAIHAASADLQVVVSNGHVQLMAAWRLETEIRARLGRVSDVFVPSFHDYEIDGVIDQVVAQRRLSLTNEQRLAVRQTVNSRVSCLTGGAGVGKTATVSAVCSVYERLLRSQIYLIAPSGIAADRLREATGRDAMTIAKFLGQTKAGRLSLEDDALVVIDESSMLCVPMFHQLLSAVGKGVRLLFVGDENQLPPIGWGLPFSQLCRYYPLTRLTQIFRTGSGSDIPVAAKAVLDGQASLPSSEAFSALEAMADADIARIATSRAAQVICATKRRAQSINRHFQALRFDGSSPILRVFGQYFYSGDKVIFGSNDYANEVWNGTVATLLDVQDGAAVFDLSGQAKHIDLSCIMSNRIDLAYAVTAHRAQGAGYEAVVVVAEESRLVTRQWLYTAITRAARWCRVIGKQESVQRVLGTIEPESVRLTQRLVPVLCVDGARSCHSRRGRGDGRGARSA